MIALLLVAMLDMEIHVHLILGGAPSMFLGLVIFLIAAMDNPFRDVSVTPAPFRQVYDTLMQPSDAVNRSMAALIAGTETVRGDGVRWPARLTCERRAAAVRPLSVTSAKRSPSTGCSVGLSSRRAICNHCVRFIAPEFKE